MKKSKEIVDQLIRYFGATVIGTQIFVDNNLLHEDDTNDIDIAVSVNDPLAIDRIKLYLSDIGFVAKDITHKENAYSKEVLIRTQFENTDYDKLIDINYFTNKPNVFSVEELIAAKFKAGRPKDLKQISMVIFNSGGKVLKSYKDLQDFYLKNNTNGDL